MELAEYLAAVQSQLGPGTLERRAACEMSRGEGGCGGGVARQVVCAGKWSCFMPKVGGGVPAPSFVFMNVCCRYVLCMHVHSWMGRWREGGISQLVIF